MGLTTLRCYLTFSTRLTLPLMVQKAMVGKTNEAISRMTVQWHETVQSLYFFNIYLFIYLYFLQPLYSSRPCSQGYAFHLRMSFIKQLKLFILLKPNP